MKHRFKTKDNHDSERIRLKYQIVLRGLIYLQFTAWCWTEICIPTLD